MARRQKGLRGSPSQHVEIAEAYMDDFPNTVKRFESAISRGKCETALDWFAEAHASIQAIAVSATHTGRREKAIRRRLNDLDGDVRKMRGKLKKTCLRKKR